MYIPTDRESEIVDLFVATPYDATTDLLDPDTLRINYKYKAPDTTADNIAMAQWTKGIMLITFMSRRSVYR